MRRRVRLAGEVFERVELAGDVAGAGDGADRGAGDDVGLEPGLDQALAARRYAPSRGPRRRQARCQSSVLPYSLMLKAPAGRIRPLLAAPDHACALDRRGRMRRSSRGSYYSELFKVPFAAPA